MRSIDDKGVALVKTIFLTTILLAVVAYAARGTRVELRIAANDQLQKRTFAVAEAGLQHAWRKLASDVGGGGTTLSTELATPTGFLGAGTDQTIGGKPYRFVSFGGAPADGYWVRIDNNSDDAGGARSDTDGQIVITSRGAISGANRIVQSVLKQLPLFGNGLFAKYSADLRGGGFTDSYDSSLGSYLSQTPGSQGNVGSNGNITNNGSPTTVNGSEYAGGTIDPGQAIITGVSYQGQPLVAFPPAPPCAGPNPTSAGITPANDYNAGSGVLRGNGSDNVVLDPAVRDYCFNSVTITAQATLTVNGPVNIYLLGSGNSNFTGNGVINATGVPSNLRIYATPSVGSITVNGGAQASMVIYAPETNLTFNGGSEIYGSAVGGTIRLTGGTNFHYDTHSANLTGTPRSSSAGTKSATDPRLNTRAEAVGGTPRDQAELFERQVPGDRGSVPGSCGNRSDLYSPDGRTKTSGPQRGRTSDTAALLLDLEELLSEQLRLLGRAVLPAATRDRG